MKKETLLNLLKDHAPDRRLNLPIDALQSPPITEQLALFLPGEPLILESVSDPRDDGPAISVTGIGGNGLFKGINLTAHFSPGDPVHLGLTAHAQENWKLAHSFPALQYTLERAILFDSATLQLSSQKMGPVNLGLWFNGRVNLSGSLGLYLFLIGDSELVFAGQITALQDGVPVMELSTAVRNGTTLGFFSLSPITLRLISRAVRSLRNETLTQPRMYFELVSSIQFKTQGQSRSIPLVAYIYDPETSIRIDADLTQGIDAALDEMKALINSVSLDTLSFGDFKLENIIKLTQLAIYVNPSAPAKVTNVALCLKSAQPWILLKSQSGKVLLTLEEISVTVGLQAPFAAGNLSAYLEGRVKIGNGLVILVVAASAKDIALRGYLDNHSRLALSDLMQHFVNKSDTQTPSLQISEFDILVRPGHHYELSASISDLWSITLHGQKIFSLEEVELRLSYTADRQQSDAQISCLMELGGTELSMTATYSTTEGWDFQGGLAEGKSIELGNILADLEDGFGIELPEILYGIRLEALKVSFNTQSKDFAFTCDGQLEIESGKEIKGSFAIDLKRRQDGSFSTHCSGKLKIEDLQFALIVDSSGLDKQLLAATYHDLQGKPRKSIKKLIEAVSPDFATSVPESLVFTVNDALLGYHKSDAGSKWLFGVDIEGGLNLSDVKLPDFPLISQFALSEDQSLKLAVQVVGAKEEFKKDEVAALTALNPGGVRLPNGDIKGLALAASLRLGQESRQLSLPIGVGKNSSRPGPGENPLKPAIDSSADATAATPHSGAQAVSADGTQWIMIQKSFGPVHFERVGIAYSNNTITGLLDAALSAGGLTIALDGLSVTSPLTHFDPTFSLHGLGIDYRNGPLEIGGSFLKQTMKKGEETYTSFAGLAVLRNKLLSLSAIGSYALKDGHPSLFIYAVLDYPLGGPAFFFVTGLAAGFGYNRALTIPTIDQVEAFPLIQNANNVQSLPAGQEEQQGLLTNQLKALEEYIPRSVGEHFLAIGIRFTSFKRIDSFALLTVKFGKELEFDLLGISTLSVPNVAEAKLLLKATFKPDSGFLGVRAQLTPNSYILSGDCHLTGGFAFYSWFKDFKDQTLPGNPTIRGGDFVLTLGGYHPAYEPPAHYPRVPRLGFNWQVDKAGSLQLKGEAYYAMTPHALMAGCHLEATWHKDQLKAWFTASADFLISWQPYHYDARLYIDLGASYTFDLFGSHTITVDLGADLHLWGPEFSGEARIHWSFISFTVSFGEGAPTGLTPIEWTTFKTAFLPEKNQICGIAVQQGLIRQVKDGVQERWIMNPKEFVLVTNSVIPSTAARDVMEIQGKPTSNPIAFRAKTDLAVRPVAVERMQSTHQITITKEGEKEFVPFAYTPVLKAMPAALWGAPQFTDNAKKDFLKPPDIHDDEVLIEKTLAGFEIRPLNLTEPGPTEPFEPRLDETELIPDAFQWEDWTLTNADLEGKGAWEAATGYQDPGLLRKETWSSKPWGSPIPALVF